MRSTPRSTSSRPTSSGPRSSGSTPQNAQGELYLTDTVRVLVAGGERVAVHIADDPAEAEGVNTRAELAAAAAVLRDRINHAHMLAGVDDRRSGLDLDRPERRARAGLDDPPVHRPPGRDAVARGAEVGPHVVAVDAEIGPGALVGPFCYLRPGTVLEAGAKAGTFVEIKNSRIGAGAKVPHQSYIGDAEIGEGTNIGAGNITANFPHEPGKPKGRTKIGAQRQDRRPQCVRCTRRDRRRCVDRRPARSSPRMSLRSRSRSRVRAR